MPERIRVWCDLRGHDLLSWEVELVQLMDKARLEGPMLWREEDKQDYTPLNTSKFDAMFAGL